MSLYFSFCRLLPEFHRTSILLPAIPLWPNIDHHFLSNTQLHLPTILDFIATLAQVIQAPASQPTICFLSPLTSLLRSRITNDISYQVLSAEAIQTVCEQLMGIEEQKDPLKGVDWKAVGSEMQKDPSASAKTVMKKRLPSKIRQIPDYYFLPRPSLPSAIAFYGACIAGGVGAGMLLEIWINKKVKEDGGVIWEFDK